MPWDSRKYLKLKQGDIKTMVRGNLTAMIWKDKMNINIWTNIYPPPTDGNFCDEHGNTLKSAIIQDDRHMGYMAKSD
jgi:hypothetical protein